MNTQDTLIQWLFATEALRVAPSDQPFWYTSGTLGPYYVNTHFLYGSEVAARSLLSQIDELSIEPLRMAAQLPVMIAEQASISPIYHDLCEMICERLADLPCDAISGGERRDFFFSIQAARLLGKPHVSIMKNQAAVHSSKDFKTHEWLQDGDLAGLKLIHIADLVTEASSYVRAWLPAVRRLGADMPWTLAVVDRLQGGRSALQAAGTELISLVEIRPDLFDLAETANLINHQQNQQIQQFMQDPDTYMRQFFADHPDFLAQQLALGGKNKERAQLCLDRGYGHVS